MYIRELIPCKLLSINQNFEGFFVETRLRNNEKRSLSCLYNPKRAPISNHKSESTDLNLFVLGKLCNKECTIRVPNKGNCNGNTKNLISTCYTNLDQDDLQKKTIYKGKSIYFYE